MCTIEKRSYLCHPTGSVPSSYFTYNINDFFKIESKWLANCNRKHQSILNEYKKFDVAGDCNAMDEVRIFFFIQTLTTTTLLLPFIYIPGTQMLPTKSGENQFHNATSNTLENSQKPAVLEIYFTNI